MASSSILFTKSSLTAGNSYIEGYLEWTSQQIASENKSQIDITYYVRKKNIDPNTVLNVPTDGRWTYVFKIGDKATAGAKTLAVTEDWTTVANYKADIPHNEDGTKKIILSGLIIAPKDTNFEGLNTILNDHEIDLGKISRAATVDSLKCEPNDVTGEITAYYTPKKETHYIRRIVSVNVNGKLTEVRSATKLGQKDPIQQESKINFSGGELATVYGAIPTSTKATIRVTFQTFSDSLYTKQIGTDQYKEITLSIPNSVAPKVTLTKTPVNSNTWLADQDIFAVGLSGATVKLTASAGDGSSLVASSIICNGTTYDAPKDNLNEIILNIPKLTKSSSIEITGKATDLRGRTTSVTEYIDVLQYFSPAVTSMRVDRGTYDSGWKSEDDGTAVRVIIKTTLALADKNNFYTAAFELDGESTSPNGGTVLTDLESGKSYTFYFLNLNNEVSHDLKLTVTDKTGQIGTATITIPTAQVTMEFHASGKGIAFGKTSEVDDTDKGAFECAWPAYFNSAVYVKDKITCPNDYTLRNFNINCNWADRSGHDMIVRNTDGLTLGIGWTGSGEDGKSYETVLDVRPKKANFRGKITAPHGRFTATTESEGNSQTEAPLRVGDESGYHIDFDGDEIQAKKDQTTPSDLNLNPGGGNVLVKGFRIPEIQHGSVKITPSAANTPTFETIEFEKAFSGTPHVIVTARTAVPGTTVLGVGTAGLSATGAKIYVTRTNTTETVVDWIAIY